MFLGVVLGLLLSLTRSTFAARLRTERDVERVLGAPLYGEVPTIPLRRGRGLVVTAPTRTRASDAYRRLAIKLFSPDAGGRTPRTIAVVGLDGRSDTSVIVANVATALALARRRVVAASASIGRPALEGVFGVPLRPWASRTSCCATRR